MTREHIFFIPLIFLLGTVLGALAMRGQLARSAPRERASFRDTATRVSGRALLLPLAAFHVLFAAPHLSALHGGPRALTQALHGQPLFDQRPSFSADAVYARIATFGPEGRAAYRSITFGSDLPFPLVLFAFLIQLTRFVSERVPALSRRARALLLLPALAWLLADLAENALLFHLLGSFPARHDALAARLTLLLAALLVPTLLSARMTGARSAP